MVTRWSSTAADRLQRRLQRKVRPLRTSLNPCVTLAIPTHQQDDPMKKHATVLCLTTALILGCSSSVETNGQVFIDSSGSATKLAQTEIYVVSEESLVNNLKSVVPAMKAEYERLHAAHKSNAEHLAKTVAFAQQAQVLAMVSSTALTLPSSTPGTDIHMASSATELIGEVSKSLTDAKEKFKESDAALTGLANGSNADFFLPKVIQGSSISATSDADGKFKLSLEAGKRVAIIAKKDKLAWLVWVNPKKGDQIFLTNKNLNGTQCETCVFNKDQLDSTLAFIPAAFSAAQTK